MSFLTGVKALSVFYAGIITSGIFLAIPLTQIATDSSLSNEYMSVSSYKAPPPPPPIEKMEKKEDPKKDQEKLELKKDFQKLNLATIDLALNVGSGGTGGASIYVGSFEVDNSDLNFDFAFEISDLDKPPVPLMQIAPMYPPDLKRAGVRGQVVAEFIVTKEGRVVKIMIKSSTHAEFNRPVMDALRRWQFEPGVKDDKNVNTRVRLPFFFNLDSA